MFDRFLWIGMGYLFGSIPLGVFVSKIFKLGNLRAIGSGNIGATNVLRTGNKLAAFLTLIGDLLKGSLPVWGYLYYCHLYRSETFFTFYQPNIDSTAICIAMAAVLGHIYPVWLHFKGGKGVATTLGSYLALSPISFLFAIMTWIIVFIFTKISSLSALISLSLMLPICLAMGAWKYDALSPLFLFAVVNAVMICMTHCENIRRLIKGDEQPMHLQKNKEAP